MKAPRPLLAVWCRAFGIDAGAADATGDATDVEAEASMRGKPVEDLKPFWERKRHA